MANEIDGTVKIKNQDIEAAFTYMGERINDVFTNVTVNQVNETENNYTGGKTIELFGVSVNAKASPIDDGKALLKIQAKPKVTGFLVALCAAVGLLALLFGVLFTPLVLIVVIIGVMGRSQANKKITRLINDVNIRFA